MGFLDYARAISFEKDPFMLKFLLVEDSTYPRLTEEDQIFKIILPSPKFGEESISFLGYEFLDTQKSRQQVAQLFRSSVFHLSGHAVTMKTSEYQGWLEGKNSVLSSYVASLVEDLRVNAFVAAWYPDRISDLSFAGEMMLNSLRRIENIRIQATRLMASLLVYANTGLKRFTSHHDEMLVGALFDEMDGFKDVVVGSIADKEMDISADKMKTADFIYNTILGHGPIVEAPSLPFTENLGPCSLFPPMRVNPELSMGGLFEECFEGLGGTHVKGAQQSWMKVSEAEALQVFDSHFLEKNKEQKILSTYEKFALSSRFSSMGFPNKDYTEYLKAKARCKKSTNKMAERLYQAMNEYMEDIRKKHGVLNLADAIQVIASKSDRTDIFLLEEKIQRSFAWSILIDASTSMRHIREYALDLAVILAETASKVLLDPTSWSVFAFNDRFEIIKDFNEQYNTKVKSRLGGLEFKGLTYLPDAMEIAGRAIGQRREELKIMAVISDGWPYGYSDILPAVTEILNQLEAADMAIIGIGAQSGRMELIFGSHCTSFTLKEFVNKFGARYFKACENAV
jgi:hypothetical protein